MGSHRPSLPSRSTVFSVVALAVAVCSTAAVMATTMKYNHDEEQYVAAVVLLERLALYRDFIHLQTPVYPLLASWVLWAAPENVYAALRWASGALFALCCLCASAVCVRACGGVRAAAVAALLFCTSPSLQAAAGSARNDILPCFFLLAGLLAAATEATRPRRDRPARSGGVAWFLCGLCLVLAVGAKVSYAFAPVAAFLYLLWPRPAGVERPAGSVLAYCAGCAAGAAPVAYHLVSAPDGFVYGVVGYHLTAPLEWYTRNGYTDMLSVPYRLAFAVKALAKEPPAVAALGLVAWSAASVAGVRGWRAVPGVLLRGPRGLIALALAGSVPFGLLPNPPQPQYMVPVFALLVLFGACCLPDVAAPSRKRRALLGLLVCTGAALGVGRVVVRLPRFLHPPSWTTARVREEALAIRAALPAGGPACVATLSPIRALGAGASIYPELASGPFFFRSGDLLRPDQVAALRGVSPSTLARMLDDAPPGAVLVGYESSRRWRVNLDGMFIAYAASRGYREVSLDAGRVRLFLNPAPSAGCG